MARAISQGGSERCAASGSGRSEKFRIVLRRTTRRSGTITRMWRMKMSQTIEEKNKALVLKAFDTLFNKHDYAAAEKYWSPNYIQHGAHIEPGRDGLFNSIRNTPDSLRYEYQLIVAEGDYVIVHGR